MAETETNKDWKVDMRGMHFPYEIMFRVPLDKVPVVSLFKKTWDQLNVLNPEVLVIDGYSYASCWAGVFWGKRNQKKIILWSSSNKDDHERVFYKEYIKKLFVAECNAYNTYGTKSRDYLVTLGAKQDNIYIMGNTTDNTFYYNETMGWRRQRHILCLQYKAPANNFLYIGRFSKEKNIFSLLDSYKNLDKNYLCQWGLILVGSGPQKTEIENYLFKNKLKNVIMAGFKQKEEIPKMLAISNVLILPSVSETWGLVVNEAMAAGLPVLVSRKCGCYPDMVRDKFNGFSFDPYDNKELFGLMKDIVDGKVDLDMMGRNSLEIIKEYTPKKTAQIVIKTLEGIEN